MTVGEYLQTKYKTDRPSVLLGCEAKAFGVPWPLKSGWYERVKDNPIKDVTLRRLERSLDGYARLAERDLKKRAKRGLEPKPVLKRLYSADRAAEIVRNLQTSGKIDPLSPAFLSSPEWRRVRYAALVKHGNKCACCGITPAEGATLNVDHIKPRAVAPELALDLSNLQVLCATCNQGKGNWDATKWAAA